MKSFEIVNIPIDQLIEMQGNSNFEDDQMYDHLKGSVAEFGLAQILVVRSIEGRLCEVVSGNWRLRVLKELGYDEAPCIILDLDDARAKLLSHALNSIHGEDDPGLKAESMRVVLESIPREAVLKILPESDESLNALSSLGRTDIAQHLQAWQRAQSARLRHLTLQLTPSQLEVVEEALSMTGKAKTDENPNARGNALAEICKNYIQNSGEAT